MKKRKEVFYFLTLFKIEGHETWRANLFADLVSFDKSISVGTKVSEKKVFKIDRITGEISVV